jgi:AraC-like DNA-binding protein
MDTLALLQQLQTSTDRPSRATAGHDHVSFLLRAGLETRIDPRKYYWDGLKRGVDPNHPIVVIQYTLAGLGHYEQSNHLWPLPPGSCFIAPTPSAHHYFLPSTSPSWTFFWLLITHDYAVRRFIDIHRQFSPVFELPPESAPITRMAGLFHTLHTTGFRDDLAVEQAVLDFTLEYERYARAISFPSTRQSLLDQVRQHVMANLARPTEVEELAQAHGMSRSHFSHYFRDATGLSPARYMTEVRLHEVAQRLAQTRQTLKTIAHETGFADANHLCKVFRRHFRTSPGQFRQHLT